MNMKLDKEHNLFIDVLFENRNNIDDACQQLYNLAMAMKRIGMTEASQELTSISAYIQQSMENILDAHGQEISESCQRSHQAIADTFKAILDREGVL